MNKILIVAAHADDEVLGCGAAIHRLTNNGTEARTIILADGVSSRSNSNRGDEIVRQKQCESANKLIGVSKVYQFGLPDNKLDSIPLLDIIKEITPIIEEYQPDTIFTHFRNDLNIDHRRCYEAVLTATRPMQDAPVKRIYSFEIASSTEWNFPLSFSPDTYIQVKTDNMLAKLEAMKVYDEEIRPYPHPRSLKGLELQAEYWAMRIGLTYAEAFETTRNII